MWRVASRSQISRSGSNGSIGRRRRLRVQDCNQTPRSPTKKCRKGSSSGATALSATSQTRIAYCRFTFSAITREQFCGSPRFSRSTKSGISRSRSLVKKRHFARCLKLSHTTANLHCWHFYATHDEQAQKFLGDEFRIEGFDSALFSLREPYWRQSKPSRE